MPAHPALRGLVLAFALACAALAADAQVAPAAVPDIAAADLPDEARATLRLIHAGGPFPYDRDGVRFGNRERLLPERARDYYREYTVATPGSRTRGARRIVCGGPRTVPEICYYTHDHYQSFARIRE
jgi:ribonuclease T1